MVRGRTLMLLFGGAMLMWAAYTHARLTVPYRLGVVTMVVAGLVAGLAGRWPGLALLSIVAAVG